MFFNELVTCNTYNFEHIILEQEHLAELRNAHLFVEIAMTQQGDRSPHAVTFYLMTQSHKENHVILAAEGLHRVQIRAFSFISVIHIVATAFTVHL